MLKLIRVYLNSRVMVDGLIKKKDDECPQYGPLSPLLSNIMLDELDKELEKRNYKFCRYADDSQIYVKSRIVVKRIMKSLTVFIEKKLKLKDNTTKSAVGRHWRRWKRIRTRFRMLRKLGIKEPIAWEYANTRKGYW